MKTRIGNGQGKGVWLAGLEECVTLDLGVMNSRPMLGIKITKINFKKNQRKRS